ncbi:response regulator [Candidatus Woesebacteria bacterium]|nr:MAG: response regulator [Candidatus Woesebacteria bacterium]
MSEKCILVAEDEDALAYALKLKLNQAGFKVRLVTTGDDVLKALEEREYDLLLLDILMPGKNGFEVMEIMREKAYKTPVVISTNLSDDRDMALAKKLGAKAYLIKTDYSLDEIVEKIEKCLIKCD